MNTGLAQVLWLDVAHRAVDFIDSRAAPAVVQRAENIHAEFTKLTSSISGRRVGYGGGLQPQRAAARHPDPRSAKLSATSSRSHSCCKARSDPFCSRGDSRCRLGKLLSY